ncbi:TolC family protein [Salinispirillum marinum]|uniref:TolC family protein n=2 Tax=Saccharospirillaceae TaxID=255527 RepID=A0ABV8BDP6_9GAMM
MKPRHVLWLTAFPLALFNHVMAEQAPLSMPEYLPLALQHHVSIQQHQARLPGERLAVNEARQHYRPQFTLSSGWEVNETARVDNKAPLPDTPFQVQQGSSVGLDATWTLPFGTQLQLGTEQQYGQQTGQTASGIPEKYQHIQQYQVEVTQPLLRSWKPENQRLPLRRAETAFEEYQLEGTLAEWAIMRESLERLIAVQAQFDRVAVFRELEEAYRYLLTVTEQQRLAGRATDLDVATAELELARQTNQRQQEEQRYLARQADLRRSLIGVELPSVAPFASLNDFIAWLSSAANPDTPYNPLLTREHPEWQQRVLARQQAEYNVREAQRQHWPTLDAFYRYQHDVRERLPDTETTSWGVRLTYRINNVPVYVSQRRAEGQWLSAQWAEQDTQAQLRADAENWQAEWAMLGQQAELLNRSVELTERGLHQQRQRLEAGFASFRDVQQQQQALLDRQQERVELDTQRAQALIERLYAQQPTMAQLWAKETR